MLEGLSEIITVKRVLDPEARQYSKAKSIPDPFLEWVSEHRACN